MADTFKKKPGTTDRGKDYEHAFIANLIIKLINNNQIDNFYLSSNNDIYGAFDDVVVEINYSGNTKPVTIACQLKQKQSGKRVLTHDGLAANEGNFSLKKYYHGYKKLKTLQDSVKLVLFTNTSYQSGSKTLNLNFDNQPFEATILAQDQDALLTTSKTGGCYSFHTSDETYKKFFKKFYLYTNQANLDKIEKETIDQMKTQFECEDTAYKEYISFITDWSMKEGRKYKLDKRVMKRVITLCVLSPFIVPLSFSLKPVSAKTRMFREATSKLLVTKVGRRSLNRIKTVWEDAIQKLDNFREANKVRTKYQIVLNYIETKDQLCGDNKETTKLLWLMGLCPLLVTQSQPTSKTIQFCQNGQFVVLGDVSQTLSSFTHDKAKISANFTFSLQGQKETPLKDFPGMEDLITTDELIQMVDGPLLIGKEEEILPPCYIPRTLSTTLTSSEMLHRLGDSVIVVSNVDDLESFGHRHHHFDIVSIDDQKLTQKRQIFVARDQVPAQKIQELFLKHPNKKCYHFKYLTSKHLELIRSTDDIDKFRKFRFRSSDTVQERELFDNPQDMNIVCANPGMGKSTLMKSLKKHSSSSLWTILIDTRSFPVMAQNEFLNSILPSDAKSFDRKVFEILVQMKQVQFVWDGMDEVSDANLVPILELIKDLSDGGFKQWITSRTNLQYKLEDKFKTFSRTIQVFDEAQQRDYIEKRLKLSPRVLEEVLSKIKENINLFINNDILGVPLQIYMLTELFYRSGKYLDLLDESFTLINLYDYFIEEKFDIYYKEKEKCDVNFPPTVRRIHKEKVAKKGWYQELAIISHFDNEIPMTTACQEFVEEIKTEQDYVGLISKIVDDRITEFMHNSYGEYFAALYLFDNYQKQGDRTFILKEKYNNIRFFLDLMLSQKCKGHVAVLYKNCQLLEECSDRDLDRTDRAGRTVLELARTWTENLPVLHVQRNKSKEFLIFDRADFGISEYYDNTTSDGELFQQLPLIFKKVVLLFPFALTLYDHEIDNFADDNLAVLSYYSVRFDYPLQLRFIEELPIIKVERGLFSHTLLAVAVEMKSINCLKQLLQFSQYRNLISADSSILCDIFDQGLYKQLSDILININTLDSRKGMAAIHHAAINNKYTAKTLRHLILNGATIDTIDNSGKLPVHYACKTGSYEKLQLLISKGASLTVPDCDGKLPIHYICTNNYYDFRTMFRLLLTNGVKINVADSYGNLPLHYACMNNCDDSDKIVQLLLENGTDANTSDKSGNLPLNYACLNKSFSSYKVVQTLVQHGAKVDVAVDGKLPLHYACINKSPSSVQKIESILEKWPRVDITDSNGKSPLYHACTNKSQYASQIVNKLLQKGAQIHTPDPDGKLPLHHACSTKSDFAASTVQILLENGAKVDAADGDGKLPIHHVCINKPRYGMEMVKSLLRYEAAIDVKDGDGKLPVHHACANPFSGNMDLVQLLISKGATVNETDGDGRTPLDLASMNDNGGGIVELLLNTH